MVGDEQESRTSCNIRDGSERSSKKVYWTGEVSVTEPNRKTNPSNTTC